MDEDESQLRSSIQEKCDRYIPELALSELCGLLPDGKMKASNFESASQAIDRIRWGLLLEAMEKDSA